MELPSFMQGCQGFRYKRGVARNAGKERGREKGTLLPAPSPPTPPPPPPCAVFFCYWHTFLRTVSTIWMPGTGIEIVNGLCTLCWAVYKSLSKGQKIGFRYCSSAPVFKSQVILENLLTNNSLRVVCHFPHRKYSMLALAHITTDVFSSGSFIPHAHFEIILVMVSYYGYEIWRHK